MPTARTLPALLTEIAARRPDGEAVVFEDRRLRWSELEHRVNEAAAGLAALGLGAGDKVALLMGNRPEWIISALAIARLGGVMVAMNTWWTAREMTYALNDSDSVALVCCPMYMKRNYAALVEGLRAAGEIPAVRRIVGVGAGLPAAWLPWEGMLAGGAGHSLPLLSRVRPDGTVFLLYTSGSTSHPKGVQLVHRSLIENVWNIGERQQLRQDDRVWLAVSLFWGLGCSNALMAALTHGSCIVLQESFDAAGALALIERERCSVLYGTPNIVQALCEHPRRAAHDLSSLRTGITIGTPEQLMRAIKLGARDVCNVYGLTETYGNCHVAGSEVPLALRIESVGTPLPGVTQKIADLETGLAVGPGVVGEIRVKGHVTPGYYKNPEDTAAALDPQGFFRTGDLGMVDAQGYLFYKGRIKEMIKTGGINVAPAEIESVLMMHPDIALAVVAGVPHATRDEILAAVIICRDGAAPTEEAVRDWCRERLAAYKVPSLIRFAAESALPLTTTGKLQKNRVVSTFFAT